MLAFIQGQAPASTKIEPRALTHFPTLLTAPWCPFSKLAMDFWTEVAQAVERPLEIISVQQEQGQQAMMAHDVGGVSCLVTGPESKFYGTQYYPSEARKLLSDSI